MKNRVNKSKYNNTKDSNNTALKVWSAQKKDMLTKKEEEEFRLFVNLENT